jgi:MoaA/NifB/PqqE/SkfB family radical SAM enzyme
MVNRGLIRSVRDGIRRVFGHREKVRLLYLEITHRCNLRCICCYTQAGTEAADALTLNEQKSVVRQAKQMRARTVSLSGSGEPLLYESLRELIDYIRELGMTVVIFTNGTVLDRDMAEF